MGTGVAPSRCAELATAYTMITSLPLVNCQAGKCYLHGFDLRPGRGASGTRNSRYMPASGQNRAAVRD
jgi:hypothetical protein